MLTAVREGVEPSNGDSTLERHLRLQALVVNPYRMSISFSVATRRVAVFA
jgi:hypothetical protein